jgi:glycerol-3-phosphate dehydrogenase
MPITHAVDAILNHGASVDAGIASLMRHTPIYLRTGQPPG